MKLVTKAIEKALPELYATDGGKGERPVICKFFTPDTNWTWYVLEGEIHRTEAGEIEDILFFGLVEGFETGLGYFTLAELKAARGPLGLPIERDLHFGEKTLAEAAPEFCERLWG